MAVLRDKETSDDDFRQKVDQISMLMAFEITKDLPTKEIQIQTPLESTKSKILDCQVSLISILRAGLGMQEAFMKILPEASVGHLGFYRNEETLEPVRYYVKLPQNLDQSIVILLDPMLATGGSLNAALELIKDHGTNKIKCVSLVSAPQGVRFVLNNHPDVEIYTAAIDRELNECGYILPGLGDAGDRLYGTD